MTENARRMMIAEIEMKQDELETQFLNNPDDAFAIFQLKHDEELRDLRFAPMRCINSGGYSITRENYHLIYTGQLTAVGITSEKLERLWHQFNIDRPDDFRGHSLSVSDIVALKQNGAVSCHYVDSFGFQKILAFLDNDMKSEKLSEREDRAEGAQKGEPEINKFATQSNKPKRHNEAPEMER